MYNILHYFKSIHPKSSKNSYESCTFLFLSRKGSTENFSNCRTHLHNLQGLFFQRCSIYFKKLARPVFLSSRRYLHKNCRTQAKQQAKKSSPFLKYYVVCMCVLFVTWYTTLGIEALGIVTK